MSRESMKNDPDRRSFGMLKKALSVILSFVFVGLICSSLRRINGDKGTAISYSSSPTVRLPSFMLCRSPTNPLAQNGPGLGNWTSLQDLYDLADEEDEENPFIVGTELFDAEKSRFINYFNRSEVEAAGLDWDSHWSKFYWSYSIFNRVFRCWNFTLTEKVWPSLLRMTSFVVKIDPGFTVWISLHDPGQFTDPVFRLLGATTHVVNRPNPDKFQVVEIARKRINRLNSPENRCDDAAEPFSDCLDDFVERDIGCQLPNTKGHNADLRVCSDSHQDAQKFLSATSKIGLQASNLGLLKNVTGCRSKCSYIQYSARPLMDMDMMGDFPHNTAKVAFTVIDPDLKEEREIYTYGWDSFTADFGGYLGLLLGLSLLKLYDIALAAAKIIMRKF